LKIDIRKGRLVEWAPPGELNVVKLYIRGVPIAKQIELVERFVGPRANEEGTPKFDPKTIGEIQQVVVEATSSWEGVDEGDKQAECNVENKTAFYEMYPDARDTVFRALLATTSTNTSEKKVH